MQPVGAIAGVRLCQWRMARFLAAKAAGLHPTPGFTADPPASVPRRSGVHVCSTCPMADGPLGVTAGPRRSEAGDLKGEARATLDKMAAHLKRSNTGSCPLTARADSLVPNPAIMS